MTKNPKNKGSSFERQICKQLSLWLTRGESATELIRSVSSGGWAARDWRHTGDIAPNGEIGEKFMAVWSVETKAYKTLDFWQHFSKENGEIRQWWTKHCEECSEFDLKPILIIKRNFYPIIIGMLSRDLARFPELEDERVLSLGDGTDDLDEVSFVMLDNFLEKVDPEDMLG
jgi:hypothetical protein